MPYFAVKLLYFAVKHCEPTVLHSIFTANSEGHGVPPLGILPLGPPHITLPPPPRECVGCRGEGGEVTGTFSSTQILLGEGGCPLGGGGPQAGPCNALLNLL